ERLVMPRFPCEKIGAEHAPLEVEAMTRGLRDRRRLGFELDRALQGLGVLPALDGDPEPVGLIGELLLPLAVIPTRRLAGERSPDLVRLLELSVLDQLGKSPQTRCRPPTFIRRSPVPPARFRRLPRR